MKLTKGTILQNYTIIEAIGEGGMGEVYLAEETLLGRQVAIKKLNPLLTDDPQFSERFINEARIQAKLIHPNIVALHNFFIEDGVYYMVMEYAAGNTLKELIAMTGPIPELRTLHIFKQLIGALGYAHSKQIIHRDIKPSNIMIDAHDNVKVMDFGIARLMSDKHLTRTGAKLGTLFYMSPEQVLAEKDIDHRTDIYSAGIVLYEMLTGKLPFSENTDSDFIVMKEITENRTPDPREVYPNISDITVAVLHKATSKKRDLRHQDCNALYSDCCGAGSEHHPFPSTNTSSQPRKDKPIYPKPEIRPKPVVLITMVLVEGGTFEMGETKPRLLQKLSGGSLPHQVTLSPFFIGKYQVTQKEWLEVMGSNPSKFRGAFLPIENISWYDAIEYCNKRSLKDGLKPCYSGCGENIICDWTANGYRLPTESEWEYAARGGNKSQGYEYSGSNDLNAVAWYNGNSGNTTHEVGSKTANELGILDMSGNVREWCWDRHGVYLSGSQNNPKGANSGHVRVLRGGCWSSDFASSCRVDDRVKCFPDFRFMEIGFRVVMAVF